MSSKTGSKIPQTRGTTGQTKDAEASTPIKKASPFRRLVPQFLAITVKNFLFMDLGMAIAFPTIVIPVLLDKMDSKNVVFTEVHASWFGSIIFACQPTGSVLSGLILESVGRKYGLMAVNLPLILAWFLMYSAASRTALYIAAIVMGLGVGFMEAPIMTYIGEVCEPAFRGTLGSYSNLFTHAGMTTVFFLGTLVDWRTAALILMFQPIITILALTLVPETPQWLMGRGREEDAAKSLQWLRGWVSRAEVEDEVQALKRYATEAQSRNILRGRVSSAMALDQAATRRVRQNVIEVKEMSICQRILYDSKDFFRPAVLKPFFLMIIFFGISNWTGVSSTRPYLIKLMGDLNFPIEPHRATVIFGSIGFTASVCCMVTIAFFKKRPIALVSVFLCSVFAFVVVFTPTNLLNGWITFTALISLYFFSLYGVSGIVWTVLSEIFPFRGRCQATGLAAAASYLITFSATKTFLSMKNALGPQYVFMVFGCCSAFGLVFLYFMLPETEGRTLEEIENWYKSAEKSNPKTAGTSQKK